MKGSKHTRFIKIDMFDEAPHYATSYPKSFGAAAMQNINRESACKRLWECASVPPGTELIMIAVYIVKARPMITVLETVREVANGYDLDSITSSDLEYIERVSCATMSVRQ